MDGTIGDRDFGDVMQLCAAVRQAEDLLFLDDASATRLKQHLDTLETLVTGGGPDSARIAATLKSVRYILLESADGPLAPFLADSAATIIGDDHGKLFFKPSP